MDRRYIEQSPQNVIWGNLSMSAYEQNIRRVISYGISVGLIVAWTFPGEYLPCQTDDSRVHWSVIKYLQFDRRVLLAAMVELFGG